MNLENFSGVLEVGVKWDEEIHQNPYRLQTANSILQSSEKTSDTDQHLD